MRFAVLIAAALLATGTAQAQVPPEEETEHVVREGETLGGIASRAKVPRILIAEANGLREPYAVRAGQKLRIPRTRRHRVESGDTGFDIAYKYGVPWQAIAVANGLEPDAPVKTGTTLLIPTVIDVAQPRPAAAPVAAPTPAKDRFAWPLAGKVRRAFTARSARNHHDGIDIPAKAGTAVRAAAEGKVIFAGEKGDFGNLVVLDHGGGWHTAYGFLSRITVRKGETARKGERVGLVGRTGLAKGDELHFEVRRDNAPLDPLNALPDR